MPEDQGTQTSVTLLMRLRDPDDREAWDAFIKRYAPTIFLWCRRFHLQDSDAADVTQEVLLKLVRAMSEFEYDPARGSFRGWLKTVTGNAVRDFVRSWKSEVRGSGDTNRMNLFSSIHAPDALDALNKEVESQYRQELLALAEQRVKLRVQPQTWQAYELLTAHEQRPADVAAQLKMPVGEVYVAKSRVMKSLRREVQELEGT